MSELETCKNHIERMLRLSQTKVIFPIITYGLLLRFEETGQIRFTESEVRSTYINAVVAIKESLGHDLHIGGRYYDAYPSRNLPRYSVLSVVDNHLYELQPSYTRVAHDLIQWIPGKICEHINERLGIVPSLGDAVCRVQLAEDRDRYLGTLQQYITKNPTNFEIFSFAIIKTHLERFGCRVYRDTRTSAHDSGVDLSTNFGAIYQIKQLKVLTKGTADQILGELKVNFDIERISDGNIVLIIDDVSKEIKRYLVDMKVQTLSKRDMLLLVQQLEDSEDRQKVLRVIYEEFRREYASLI